MTEATLERVGEDPSSDRTVSIEELDGYRRELTAYCYRMLGSRSKPRTPSRTRWCAPGRRSTGSRAARRFARGCTASPPTCAWTCSRAVNAAPARWTSVRPARLRPPFRSRSRSRPGSNRCPTSWSSRSEGTRPPRRRPGSRSGSRSWPRSSTCRHGSARSSSCVRSCTGTRTRWRSCSARACLR